MAAAVVRGCPSICQWVIDHRYHQSKRRRQNTSDDPQTDSHGERRQWTAQQGSPAVATRHCTMLCRDEWRPRPGPRAQSRLAYEKMSINAAPR